MSIQVSKTVLKVTNSICFLFFMSILVTIICRCPSSINSNQQAKITFSLIHPTLLIGISLPTDTPCQCDFPPPLTPRVHRFVVSLHRQNYSLQKNVMIKKTMSLPLAAFCAVLLLSGCSMYTYPTYSVSLCQVEQPKDAKQQTTFTMCRDSTGDEEKNRFCRNSARRRISGRVG